MGAGRMLGKWNKWKWRVGGRDQVFFLSQICKNICLNIGNGMVWKSTCNFPNIKLAAVLSINCRTTFDNERSVYLLFFEKTRSFTSNISQNFHHEMTCDTMDEFFEKRTTELDNQILRYLKTLIRYVGMADIGRGGEGGREEYRNLFYCCSIL